MGDVFTDPFGTARAAKSRERAEQEATRRAQEARAEQRRLEEKFGITPGELEREQRAFELEKGRQQELERRAGIPGEQLIREQGPITSSLLDEILSRQGLTGEELFTREGDVNRQFVDTVTNFDEKAFQDELDLVLQSVDQEANRRGVFGGSPEGGIRFENLGRAGVDLAVRKATERLNQQQALSQAFVNLATGARGEAAQVGQSALNQSQGARDEIANLLANLQNLGQQSRGRAANVATSAFGTGQGAVNQFGSVPIEFAASDFGQAREQGAQLAGGLGSLGSLFLEGPVGAASKAFTRKVGLPGDRDDDRDILSGIFERSGSRFG